MSEMMYRIIRVILLITAIVVLTTSLSWAQNGQNGQNVPTTGNSGGGGAPSGPAGSEVVGTYPSNLTVNRTLTVAEAAPFTLSATGTFTDTQQNEYFLSTIGSALSNCNPGYVFTNVILPNGHFGSDALAGMACIPSSSVSNAFSSGIAGYNLNNGSSSACTINSGHCSGVGVSGIGLSEATGAWEWGGNFVAQSTAGHPTLLQGTEVDDIFNNTGDTGAGVVSAAFGSAQPSISYLGAFEAAGSSSVKWPEDFLCDMGSSYFGLCLLARPVATGNSQNSTAIEMDATGPAGANIPGQFQEQFYGTLKLIGSGAFLQNAPVNFSAVPACSSTSEGTISSIKDSSTAILGATITGSGSNHVLGYCDAAQWLVAGIANGTSTATLTPGTNVTSVTCLTATCTNLRGTISIVGGTATTGTVAALSWTATPTAYVCTATENPNTGTTTQLGVNHNVATTTGVNIAVAVSIAGLTLEVDYSCRP